MVRLRALGVSAVLVLMLLAAATSYAASTAVSVGALSVVSLPTMTAYCQTPPLKSEISPNIMLLVDVSGSMGWNAYSGVYDSTRFYEGYFDPSKFYVNISGVGNALYEERVLTGIPCTPGVCQTWSCQTNNTGSCDPKGTHSCASNKYACCTSWSTVPTGDCGNPASGNYLNFLHMDRVDLFRWAMTGGKPASCGGGAGQGLTGNDCDPETWADSGNAAKIGAACNNSLDVNGDGIAEGGCILQMNDKTQVKVRWERVTGYNPVSNVTGTNFGLVYSFARMPVKPRMGAMFFDGNGIRANKVYLGDFTGANSKTAYSYYNMITLVNSQDPGGMTPTGPAMWDTYNYFAMNPPQYGGFPQQTGTGDRWKNPMYDCDNGGANCRYIPCTDNFVILMSDGDWNMGGDPAAVTNTCSIDTGTSRSADPVVPAYVMHSSFLNSATSVTTKVRGVYSISLFMDPASGGINAMQNIALYGSFDRSSKAWPSSLTSYPSATCGSCKGSLCAGMPPSSLDWDADGNNIPDTYFSGNNAIEIKNSIMAAVLDILTHTSAGTAASVLASREGSGANLLQAVYYPKRAYANQTIDWVGNLQNLWYYIDPAFSNSSMREDGRDSTGAHDFVLNLKTDGPQKDYITQFYFDSGLQAAMANRWTDNNGDSSIAGETQLAPIKVDDVANIWEAGRLLWQRSPWSRRVYTTVTGTSLIDFTCTGPGACASAAAFSPYLCDPLWVDTSVASTIMQWTLGFDNPYVGVYAPSYRSRQATIDSVTNTWKLGDVVNSTPKISTWQPLGDYNIWYSMWENTYGPPKRSVYQSDTPDPNYYTTSKEYKGRGMVYVGANDGMLHAFRLGLLQTKWPGQGKYEKAKLTNKVCSVTRRILCDQDSFCPAGETCSGTVTLGDEVWAFIPKNVLPYLRFMADPTYCHVYTVDLTPLIFDASFAKPSVCIQSDADIDQCYRKVDSWRTVLIGGMRLGGGCRFPSATCTDCVRTPVTEPYKPGMGLGYSSYFALDITNQNFPSLMWEYDGFAPWPSGAKSNRLGMAYSGPAVVRVNNITPLRPNADIAAATNGKWYVIFGSGPTGPIDANTKQFMGKSDQNLTMHVFELGYGPGTDNANVKVIDSGIPRAFAGSITVTSYDIHKAGMDNGDYSDDVVYIPYTKDDLVGGFTGGVGRLRITSATDPTAWKFDNVITDTGPITAAPALLKDPITKDIWLLFGTGRYFYDSIAATDDANPVPHSRQIFGMKEWCLNATKDAFQTDCETLLTPAPSFCGTPVTSGTCGTLKNVTNIIDANSVVPSDPNFKGWYINLDDATLTGSPSLWGERVITNPSVDGSGIAYFTTFKPQNDPCYKGGQTNIWAVKFDTGGAATGLIAGTAIIQVSTGSIEQVDLSKAFTQKDGRRTSGMTGQPPTREGLTVLGAVPGKSKPLFMKER